MGIKLRFLNVASSLKNKRLLRKETKNWYKYELKYSSTFHRDEKTTLSWLLIKSHIIEKGITMPNRRLGFGYDRVRQLIVKCKQVVCLYSTESVELQSTINVLEEYLLLHKREQFILPDDIEKGIEELLKYKSIDTKKCYEITRDLFFSDSKDFLEFAHQRHSVRWYSDEPIDKAKLIKAIQLAQTAPSACNRQSTKVYVVDSEEKKQEVLKLQTGNRGFGDRADKILLLTADMRCWAMKERSSAYLDTGIFAMNLLYSLQYYHICACTLNAHLSKQRRDSLRNIVGYSQAEMPVVFILIGNAPDKFMIPGSQRLPVNEIFKFV